MNPLMKKLLAASPTKNAAIMSESIFFNKKDVIPTDIPIINLAFSGELSGGLTTGLTLLAGPSKSYKSLLSLVCVRAYFKQYPDAIAILYDSEGGMSPEYLRAQGIDPSRVIHVPIEHLEMLKYDIVRQLKEINRGDKVIFVIDSIGNTGSLKEIEDALDEKSVAELARAKIIKGLFRMVTPSLVAKDIPCITICHTYSTMEMYCLHGDTLIRTKSGNVPIRDINVGDYVYALNNQLKEVTHKYLPEDLPTKDVKYMKLTFDDGHEVMCTHTHKFLMKDGTWKCAGDMVIGDDFM